MIRQATRGRFFRAVMAVLSLSALVGGLRAQDNPAPASAPAPAASSNRFLFVLDVSAPMRKHTQDVVNVVQSILSSSASGQLHNGDTIGVWTFNDDVHTGIMPLETWSVDDSDEIVMRIAEFIRQQDYEKKSRLDMVMAPIAKVIKMSDILTVFIVSSGAGQISGTPYDDDINAQYRACLHDMGKKQMPIVTVLQGKDGKFIRYTVNALPWPVVIPELPLRVKIPNPQPAAPAPAITSTTPETTSPTNASVAMNSAPQPVQPPATSAPPPAASANAAAPVAVAPPVVVPPVDVHPPASVASAGPPPNIPNQFMPQPAQPAKPAPTPTPPAEVSPPVPPPAPAPVAPPVVAQTASAAPATPPEPVVKPATRDQLPIVPPRQPPLVPKTLPADAVMAEHAAPAIPAPAPRPSPTAAAPQSAAATPAPAPPKTLVSQAAALIKSFTSEHRSILLVGGIGLLVVASALIVFMARGSRPRSRVSLISQTMNDSRR